MPAPFDRHEEAAEVDHANNVVERRANARVQMALDFAGVIE
jgi:hypothetical protein